MHVPEHSAGRHSRPAIAARGAYEIIDVEVFRRHVQLALVVTPGVARTIRVHFDPKTIGIGQIDRFAYEVIRHSGVYPDLGDVRDEASERCAIRQQNRKVIKAEQSALRHWSRAAEMVELNDLTVLRMLFTMRPETHRVGAAADHSHSQHFLVERDRSLEIGDLKSDSAEVRRLRQ